MAGLKVLEVPRKEASDSFDHSSLKTGLSISKDNLRKFLSAAQQLNLNTTGGAKISALFKQDDLLVKHQKISSTLRSDGGTSKATTADPSFARNPDFLSFTLEAARRAGHPLGFNEVKALADQWNKQHANRNSRVVVTESEFLKLALRDPHGASDGQLRLSAAILNYVAHGQIPKGLSHAQQEILLHGDLKRWEKHWDKVQPPMPFTFKDFMDSLNHNYSAVKLRPGLHGKDGKPSIEMMKAMELIGRRMGVGAFRASISPQQAEEDSYNYTPIGQQNFEKRKAQITQMRKEEETAVNKWKVEHGREPTDEERRHIILGAGWDKLIRQLGCLPSKVYSKLTCLSAEDAPYAFAALEFLGGIIASPAALVKQGVMLDKNAVLYIKDVLLNAPENTIGIFKALNVFDPNISGPERFTRMLNVVALLAGSRDGGFLKGLENAPPSAKAAMREALQEIGPVRMSSRRMQAGSIFPTMSAADTASLLQHKIKLRDQLYEKLTKLDPESRKAIGRAIQRLENEIKIAEKKSKRPEVPEGPKVETCGKFEILVNLNNRQLKVLKSLLDPASRASVRWTEVEELLSALCTIKQGSGSRIKIKRNDKTLDMHSKHHGDESIGPGRAGDVIKFLQETGVINKI
jgi:hypothetical protein